MNDITILTANQVMQLMFRLAERIRELEERIERLEGGSPQ